MAELPQVTVPHGHLFADGIVMRYALYPKGMAIVGAEYKKSHIFQLIRGRMLIDADDEATEISSGDIFVGEAGCQKAAYMIEDCVVACYYGTQAKSEAELVKEFTTTESKYLVGGSDNSDFLRKIREAELCLA